MENLYIEINLKNKQMIVLQKCDISGKNYILTRNYYIVWYEW